ncbi:Hypothetical protein KVN_LOCUS491 [uncultured virus]|nr:Hypothetical protein KVN_LOCUS491 [uncultured virus]
MDELKIISYIENIKNLKETIELFDDSLQNKLENNSEHLIFLDILLEESINNFYIIIKNLDNKNY